MGKKIRKMTGAGVYGVLGPPGSKERKILLIAAAAVLFFSLYLGGCVGILLAPEALGFSFSIPHAVGAVFTSPTGRAGFFVMLILFAALAAFLLWSIRQLPDEDGRGFSYSKRGTYGTSRFLREKEYAEFLQITESASETKGIILGRSTETGHIVSVPMDGTANRNTATCGNQGSRKSRCFARNLIIQSVVSGHSVVVIDPKQELFRDTAAYAKGKGYDVQIWNLKNLWHSSGWDILKEFENPQNIDIIVDSIIRNTGGPAQSGDKFYDNIEKSLLRALCLYVWETCDPGSKTIGEAFRLLQHHSLDSLDTIFEELKLMNPESPAVLSYNLFKVYEKAKAIAFTGLTSRMDIWQNKVVQMITGTDEIDIGRVAEKRTILYCIASDADRTYSMLNSAIIGMLFKKLYENADNSANGECTVPVEFILDEFPNVGYIDGFPEKLATARGRNIGIHLMFQSIPQFANRWPDKQYLELLGGCNYNIFMGANEYESAEHYSKLCGMTTTKVDTEKRTYASIRFTDWTPDFNLSEGDGKRELATMDEVLRITDEGKGKLLLFVNAKKPIVLDKFDFSEHPEALLCREMSAENVYPSWRFDKNGVLIPFEDAKSGDRSMLELLAEGGKPLTAEELFKKTISVTDGSLDIVRDSKKYGPSRSRLLWESDTMYRRYEDFGCTPNGQPFLTDRADAMSTGKQCSRPDPCEREEEQHGGVSVHFPEPGPVKEEVHAPAGHAEDKERAEEIRKLREAGFKISDDEEALFLAAPDDLYHLFRSVLLLRREGEQNGPDESRMPEEGTKERKSAEQSRDREEKEDPPPRIVRIGDERNGYKRGGQSSGRKTEI